MIGIAVLAFFVILAFVVCVEAVVYAIWRER